MTVELRNISKNYQVVSQTVHALREITVKIATESRVAIRGKSGAGKSTLLHVIGTLERPSGGVLKINDTDISGITDDVASSFRNSTIGFVFQAGNLLPEFSALENVMMPGLIRGLRYGKVRDKARRLLERTGLGKRHSHRPSELSGGEQQRVAIARALIMTPSLLLADEPTGNLDKNTGLKIRDLLFDLCTEYKATMLLVTHDSDLAGCFKQTILMEDGRIIEQKL